MSDYTLEGVKWEDPGHTITWSVADQNSAGRPQQFSSFMPPDFLADVEAALAKWASVANLHFQQVADSDASDIRFGMNAIDGPDNVVGETAYSATVATGADGLSALHAADIAFDSDESWSMRGGREVSADNLPLYQVALHEIGHALGLDHYTGGPAIMNPMAGTPDLTSSDIDGIRALYGAAAPDVAGLVEIDRPGQTVTASFDDVFENDNKARTTFIFGQGYDQDVVDGFRVAGPGHDVLSLLQGDFHSVHGVLAHTANTADGALIQDPLTGDTIQLTGVSRAALIHHRADITLHA